MESSEKYEEEKNISQCNNGMYSLLSVNFFDR